MKVGYILQTIAGIAFFAISALSVANFILVIIALVTGAVPSEQAWYSVLSIILLAILILFFINCGIAGIKHKRSCLAYGIFLIALITCVIIFDVFKLFSSDGEILINTGMIIGYCVIGSGLFFIIMFIIGSFIVRDRFD